MSLTGRGWATNYTNYVFQINTAHIYYHIYIYTYISFLYESDQMYSNWKLFLLKRFFTHYGNTKMLLIYVYIYLESKGASTTNSDMALMFYCYYENISASNAFVVVSDGFYIHRYFKRGIFGLAVIFKLQLGNSNEPRWNHITHQNHNSCCGNSIAISIENNTVIWRMNMDGNTMWSWAQLHDNSNQIVSYFSMGIKIMESTDVNFGFDKERHMSKIYTFK